MELKSICEDRASGGICGRFFCITVGLLFCSFWQGGVVVWHIMNRRAILHRPAIQKKHVLILIKIGKKLFTV
jgi:hypothetical protein